MAVGVHWSAITKSLYRMHLTLQPVASDRLLISTSGVLPMSSCRPSAHGLGSGVCRCRRPACNSACCVHSQHISEFATWTCCVNVQLTTRDQVSSDDDGATMQLLAFT